MRVSYHVHSTFSDGLNTIAELAEAAVEAGLDELGISDHYVHLADGRAVDWSMPLSALPDYFAAINAAAAETAGRLVMRCGVEADFDPGTHNELAAVLARYPFDYVIGSVHFIDGFAVDERRENWDALNVAERDEMMKAYWDRIAQMARSRLFDFAGHLDLYKKFGHLPESDISREIMVALDAIAQADMAVELNIAGWHKPDIREAYPSSAIVAGCRRRGIPMVMTADAHRAQDLTTSFDRAIHTLRTAGYESTAVYERRKRRLVPLPPDPG